MIIVRNLKKKYGHLEALKDVSFQAETGEIVALLGPNGAGKTTTMKIITGFLKASSGEVIIDDLNIDDNTLALQKRIGYLPENCPLYPDLNVLEHLEFSAKIHDITGEEQKKAINYVVHACALKDKLYFDISELSKGYKQRVALAQAIIHNPDIIILDEPTTGLDPNQIKEIRELIKKLGKTKTIILSTHIMQEVEALADRVLVINKGKLIKEGTPEELMTHGHGSHKINVTVQGPQKEVIAVLERIHSVVSVKKEETIEKGVTIYTVLADADIRSEVNKALVKADLDLLEIKIEKQSMEEVFAELTK